jgi:hypothetical protein
LNPAISDLLLSKEKTTILTDLFPDRGHDLKNHHQREISRRDTQIAFTKWKFYRKSEKLRCQRPMPDNVVFAHDPVSVIG